MKQLNTQLPSFKLFIISRHKTSLQIIIANSIYRKSRSKGIVTALTTVGVTINYHENTQKIIVSIIAVVQPTKQKIYTK